MADQSALGIFLVVSTVALWGIVIWLTCIHISEYIKRRVRIRALVMDDRGGVRDTHELGKQKELLIGKSTPAKMVNIDFSDSAYAASIEEEHAALVRYGSYWYVCARAQKGMVGLRQKEGNVVYKLRRGIPYRISRGDIRYISYEKIVLE